MLRFGPPLYGYWFLLPILDNLRHTPYLAIRRPPRNKEEDYLLSREIAQGKKLVGLSSYGEFPNREGAFLQNYQQHFILWCHCFRDDESFIPASMPRLLLSESDLYPHVEKLMDINALKEFDFLCYLPTESPFKNHERAIFFIHQMTPVFRFLVISGKGRHEGLNVPQLPFQPWPDFLHLFARCRFFLCFATSDPSPRMIIEALCLDIPVLINKDIVGGWKYIVPGKTGDFIDLTSDPEIVMSQIVSLTSTDRRYAPREYIREHFSPDYHARLLHRTLFYLEHLSLDAHFDYFLYINLDNRLDRRLACEMQLLKMGIPKEKWIKIDAVLDKKNGHLGCCQSHIKALQQCLQMDGQRFCILEDDFTFALSRPRSAYMLQMLITDIPDFDVFLFYAFPGYQIRETMGFFQKVGEASSTIGYAVSRKMLPILLRCFQKSKNLLLKETENSDEDRIISTPFAIDQVWKALQERYLFYTTIPMLGSPNPKLVSSITS